MLSKFFLEKQMVWLGDERERVGLYFYPHTKFYYPRRLYIYMPYFCVWAAHRRAIRILLSQTVTLYTYSNAYIYAICFIYFSLGVAKKNRASYTEIRNAICVHEVGGHLCMVLTWTFVQCWCWYRGAFGKSESLPDHPATSSQPRFVLFIFQIRENLS